MDKEGEKNSEEAKEPQKNQEQDPATMKIFHGLPNTGAGCYQNAVYHTLFNTQCLQKELFELVLDEKEGDFTLLEYIQELYKISLKEPILLKTMQHIHFIISSYFPDFDNDYMHDAHEFLRMFISKIEEQLDTLNKKKNLKQPIIDYELKEHQDKQAEILWQEHLQLHDNVLSKNVYGQFRSTFQCKKCENKQIKYEEFSDIQLPLPEIQLIKKPEKTEEEKKQEEEEKQKKMEKRLYEEQFRREIGMQFDDEEFNFDDDQPQQEEDEEVVTFSNIVQNLEDYQKPEDLELTCEKCDHKDQSRRCEIYRLPKILVIGFQRFSMLEMGKKKNTFVTFPQIVEIYEIFEEKKVKYQLYSKLNHEGFSNGGHYTCQIRVGVDFWIQYDDDRRTKFTYEKRDYDTFGCQSVYMMFYQRIENQ